VRRRAGFWLALAACALPLACASAAERAAPAPLEYQVKAVFLLRIAQFTEWPPGAAHPFSFCVVGDDPFGPVLDRAVDGERVGGRATAVRRLHPREPTDGCDLLFLSPSVRASAKRILARAAKSPTLTVADYEGFVGAGGAVELYLDEGFVRFRIDRSAASAAGLTLRSQLLRAATLVREG
jgi:hypothetical protein